MKAFTLIEVMIAIVILSFINILLLSSLISTVRLKEDINNSTNGHYLARQALYKMTNDISMAYLSKNISKENSIFESVFLGEKDRISFFAFGNIIRIRDSFESDQREINFFLKKDFKTDKIFLMRRNKIFLDNKMGIGGLVQVLCPFINYLEFQYFDVKQGEWRYFWNSKLKDMLNRLPSRVKIKIVMQFPSNSEHFFFTQSSILIKIPFKM